MPARQGVSHSAGRWWFGLFGALLAVLIGSWAQNRVPQASARLFAAAACDDAPVCAAGVFCSGFEEGNKTIWDDYDGNPDSTNLLMTDPGPVCQVGQSCDADQGSQRWQCAKRGRPRQDTPDRARQDVRALVPQVGTWIRLHRKESRGADCMQAAGTCLAVPEHRPNGSDWFSTWPRAARERR